MSERRWIAWEGVETEDGRYIEPGVLTWKDPIPIVQHTDDDHDFGRITGSAFHVERSEHGAITAEFSLEIPKGFYPAVDLMDTETIERDGVLVFTQGRITSVTLTRTACWIHYVHRNENEIT